MEGKWDGKNDCFFNSLTYTIEKKTEDATGEENVFDFNIYFFAWALFGICLVGVVSTLCIQ